MLFRECCAQHCSAADPGVALFAFKEDYPQRFEATERLDIF